MQSTIVAIPSTHPGGLEAPLGPISATVTFTPW